MHKGVFLELLYQPNSILKPQITLSVIGEWDGKPKVALMTLRTGIVEQVGPFSCISSFQIDKEEYDEFYGSVEISVKKNDFTIPILNTQKRNTNAFPKEPLVLSRQDFCNLFLPTDYTLYVIGWIRKDEFLQECRKYTGWVWPYDKVDKYKNQPWSQITEEDQRRFEKTGFATSIQNKPRLLKAGWLKTTGRGGGACCYVFPNIGANGGVKN